MGHFLKKKLNYQKPQKFVEKTQILLLKISNVLTNLTQQTYFRNKQSFLFFGYLG